MSISSGRLFERRKLKKKNVWCAEALCSVYSVTPKNVPTDLTKSWLLLIAHGCHGYRLSVRPRAGSENVIARAKVWERRNLSGIRTEGCFRGGGGGRREGEGEDVRPLESSSTTSSRRGGPPPNIHELPNAGSPRPRRPPPRVSSLLPFLFPRPLYPLPPSSLPSFLPPASSTVGGNLSASPRSILAKRPRGIDFNLGFADLFRPPCLNRPEKAVCRRISLKKSFPFARLRWRNGTTWDRENHKGDSTNVARTPVINFAVRCAQLSRRSRAFSYVKSRDGSR